MSYDPEEEKRKAAAKKRSLPGNFGGETLRQYCGLSAHRAGRRGISAQTLFKAIVAHGGPK